MIKNAKQAKTTKNKLNQLMRDRDEMIAAQGQPNSAGSRLAANAFNGLITDLESQLEEYQMLTNGEISCLNPKDISGLPKTLIAARIAQNMSQGELAGLLGVHSQQIQRDEATEYEGASHSRIVEVARVLKVNCKIAPTYLMDTTKPMEFVLPEGVSQTSVDEMTKAVQQNGSILMD
ncbi:MAG: helix-turn-helix transcriptional regulator [Bacteroidota bacterium]